MDKELVSIKVAAKALEVSEKTILRYLKTGRLSTVKEGRRTYLLSNEVRTFKQTRKTEKGQSKGQGTDTKDTVSLTRVEYEKLLTELGELRERNRLLLEYRLTKDSEINELKQKLEAVERTPVLQGIAKKLFSRFVK
ncbi:MAG: helix-turn-helix domain-containing protein [Nitrospirae bacterium]|nr:helix-turn-helix domain-containing protein [Nitrospirota bacterium]